MLRLFSQVTSGIIFQLPKLVFFALLLISAYILISQHPFMSARLPVIALTQIVAHPSLDKVRQGVVDELAKQGYVNGKTVRLVIKNAQGNLSLAAQIAKQFVSEQPKVIIAIATPSAQTVVRAAQIQGQAVIFASITDPLKAQLVDNLQHPGKNVTGTRNVTPFREEARLIKQLGPSIKRLGILFNSSEVNSVQMLKAMREACKMEGIEVDALAVSDSSTVPLSAELLVTKVNALFLMQDNTVASALPSVLQAAKKAHLPVFSSFVEAVQNGAVAGIAADEYRLGEQTGQLVVRILKGEKPGDLSVEDPRHLSLAINKMAAEELHLVLPPELLKKADVIYPKNEQQSSENKR